MNKITKKKTFKKQVKKKIIKKKSSKKQEKKSRIPSKNNKKNKIIKLKRLAKKK
jgi:hypothetical protein